MMDDSVFMKEALALATLSAEEGEIPVGAVVVKDGQIIGRGRNLREKGHDAVCHAECVAISEACRTVGDWRLSGCTLYVTLEPCPMCAGAVINSRLDRVVFGARDKDGGACVSKINLFELGFSHRPAMREGVLGEECSSLLTEFFKKRR